MGRLALRDSLLPGADYSVIQINEIGGDAAAAAHLLQFDSVHGPRLAADGTPLEVSANPEGTALLIDGREIGYSSVHSIPEAPWEGVDLVLDATGAHKTTRELNGYLEAGVAKVVVSAPLKDGPLNVVYGVNDHLYDPADHHIVSAASCTTNCIAPVISVLLTKFGIRRGAFTSIHALTNTQRVLDGFHKDLRRARASATSLIPTTTGSATAIFEIFPELTNKLDGVAVRVPIAQASLADCTFELARGVTVDEVNAAFAEAARGKLQGVLGIEERPLVSIDYEGERRSAVVDAPSTRVIDDRLIKVMAWYDNETGYVARMMELVNLMVRKDQA